MSGARRTPDQAAVPQRPAAQPAPPPQGQAPCAASARRWRSTDLFGRAQEIEIEHGQAVYRLRLTSLGKLILTK